MQQQERSKMLGTMPMNKLVPKVAVPIMISMLVQALYNVVDSIFVAKLSQDAMNAVSLAFPLQTLCIAFSGGTGVGMNALLSRSLGEKNQAGADRAANVGLFLTLCNFALFALIGWTLAGPFFRFQTDNPQIITYGRGYVTVCIGCSIGLFFQMYNERLLQSTGRTNLSMITQIAGAATNIVLDPILIFGLLGFPALGLRGAAIATSIARYVEFLVLFAVVYIRRTPVAASFKQLFCHLDRAFAARYFKTALPAFINETLWSIGISLNTVAYGMLGTSALAAVQIGDTVSKLFMVLTRGLSDACAIRTGHLIGAGDNEGALRDSTRFLVLIPLMSTVMCALLYLFRPQILTFFDVTPETRVQAMEMLALQALRQIPCAFNNTIIVGLCRSGGDTVFACILDTATVWLVGVPLSFLGVYLGFPLWGVCLCVMMGDLVKSVVGLPRILSKKWLHNVVADPA